MTKLTSKKFNILGLTLGPTKHIVCDKDGYQTKATTDYQEALALMGRLDMTNSDSYYEIGAGHIYCEDYAFHGQFRVGNKPFYFALVSDGCSASKNSDFGSRFLARSFPGAASLAIDNLGANYAQDDKVLVEAVRYFIFEKLKQGMNIDLDPSAFDATLVALVYDVADDRLLTFAWGDGNIFYKLKQGDNGTLTNISYVKNAPYYLSYQHDPARDIQYEAQFGTMYADVMPYIIKPDGHVAFPNENKAYQKFHFEKFEKVSETLSFASVFTDGIETYHNKDDINLVMPRHNVINQLTQYKGTHGKFVERRMLMVKKFCQKEGWQHYDDIAAATISFS